MEEQQIISATFASREAFNTFRKYELDNSLSDIGKILFEKAEDFYLRDTEASEVDVNVVEQKIVLEFPKQQEVFKQALRAVNKETDYSVPNLVELIIRQKQSDVGQKLVSALSNSSVEKALGLMEEYMSIERDITSKSSADDKVDQIDIASWLEKASNKHKLRIRPQILNEAVGKGLFKGNTMLVYGRPNAAKTLFCINLVGGFIEDGHKVTWFENEDPLPLLVPRIIARVTRQPVTGDMLHKAEELQKLWDAKCADQLQIRKLYPGTFSEIDALIEETKPDVVVVNQIRNIRTGKQERTVQLEQIATEMRNLAAKHNVLMIEVTQAGESAKNKLHLSKEDVDSSKTGIPGQIDLMVGIGTNLDFEDKDWRMLNIAKTKFAGEVDGTHFPVKINKQTSEIKGI